MEVLTITKRLGRQTPTVDFVIEYDESLADEAITYYERTGNKVYDWQKNLLEPIMAVEEDLWVHQKFGH